MKSLYLHQILMILNHYIFSVQTNRLFRNTANMRRLRNLFCWAHLWMFYRRILPFDCLLLFTDFRLFNMLLDLSLNIDWYLMTRHIVWLRFGLFLSDWDENNFLSMMVKLWSFDLFTISNYFNIYFYLLHRFYYNFWIWVFWMSVA